MVNALKAVGVTAAGLWLPTAHSWMKGSGSGAGSVRVHRAWLSLGWASSGTTFLSFAEVPPKSSLIPGGKEWVWLA